VKGRAPNTPLGAGWSCRVVGFFGRFEHVVDAKGRLILPVKFRPAFERGAYVSQGDTGCLSLWTPEEFESRMDEMQGRIRENPSDRNLLRVWAAGSQDVEIDRQGRLALPGHLREFARLEPEGPVLVTGAIDRVELWNPQRWAQSVAPEERRLLEGEPAV
jgi:MraZ protein